MLREDLRYVSLDFETTGLDTEKDEPIQIGIVEYNAEGKIVSSFSSYLKPERPMNELKDMVRVTTGIVLSKVADAPSFDSIRERIQSYFGEQTVLIGQNVEFDKRILQRYMDASIYASIDTFPLAQALIPFSPSYALEVLAKAYIPTHPESELPGLSVSYHDALYDAYATGKLWYECMKRIANISEKFPEVDTRICKADAPLQKIRASSKTAKKELSFPVLSKIYPTDKKLTAVGAVSKEKLGNSSKYFIGNTAFKELLTKLPKENIIYAFSQRHKSYMAKSLLHEIGLTHIDIGSTYSFDKDMLTRFFSKPSFQQYELYFTLKYYFHALQGHSTIDLNAGGDRKLYHALKDRQAKTAAKSCELLTHEQLYEKLDNQEIKADSNIIFFDLDRWYNTHSKFELKPFDLHSLLTIIDSFIYRHELADSTGGSLWSSISGSLLIFVGVWQTEVINLLRDVKNDTVEVDNLRGSSYFYKTNLLLDQISSSIKSLQEITDAVEYDLIADRRKRFTSIVSEGCSIQTKLYGDEVRFVVKPLHSYLDYSEFEQLFTGYPTTFLSAYKKELPSLITDPQPLELPVIHSWPGKEKLSYEGKNIYIFNNNKATSQELLVRLYANKPELYKVHGENITGGKGKNIFAIKSSEYNIIIGGYDFFLQCISQKVKLDKIYTLSINGPLEHLISTDLHYYGSITLK